VENLNIRAPGAEFTESAKMGPESKQEIAELSQNVTISIFSPISLLPSEWNN